ncbi:MAG: hypothetical protein ACHBN1_17485 [Heteroscytonema crispum UTEX LB 1556]
MNIAHKGKFFRPRLGEAYTPASTSSFILYTSDLCKSKPSHYLASIVIVVIPVKEKSNDLHFKQKNAKETQGILRLYSILVCLRELKTILRFGKN